MPLQLIPLAITMICELAAKKSILEKSAGDKPVTVLTKVKRAAKKCRPSTIACYK
jgi:hypothetical protein